MIKNLRLFGKISLLATLVPLAAILLAGIGLYRTNSLKYEYDNLYGFMLIPIANIDQGANHLAYLGDDLHQFMAGNLSEPDKTALAQSIQSEDDQMAAMITRYNNEWVTTASPEFTATLESLGKISLQTEETDALTQFESAHQSFQKHRDALLAGQSDSSTDINQDLADMKSAFDTLVRVNLEFADLSNTAAQSAISQMTWELIVAGVLVSLLGLLVAIWLARMVITPITRLSKATELLAQGELDIHLVTGTRDEIGQMTHSFSQMVAYLRSMAEISDQIADGNLAVVVTPKSERDVLGNSFSRMIVKLSDLVGKVARSAAALNTASTQLALAANQAGQATSQIATTIQQVSQGITQETEGVTHTTTSIEQMSRAIDGVARGAQEQAEAVQKASGISAQINTAIQQVAENIQSVTQEADKAATSAQDGDNKVKLTLDRMEAIQSKVGLSAGKVSEMGQHSERITVIVETIEDIASQTNLLALNAAIEAARAGEQGKGFAVVADEVRKLAERASASTKEIGALIQGIQRTVREAVTAMQEGSHEVETGLLQANDASAALQSILRSTEAVTQQATQATSAAEKMSASALELVAAVNSVSAVVEENTAATEQMAAGSNEVTQAIENIAAVSEENSASVEEVSAATEQMSAQVGEVSALAKSLEEMALSLKEQVVLFKLA